jgi:hypothetical protein
MVCTDRDLPRLDREGAGDSFPLVTAFMAAKSVGGFVRVGKTGWKNTGRPHAWQTNSFPNVYN